MNIIGKRVISIPSMHEGIVLGISTEYEELREGVGQFPVFIILKDDGKIENVSTNSCIIIKED